MKYGSDKRLTLVSHSYRPQLIRLRHLIKLVNTIRIDWNAAVSIKVVRCAMTEEQGHCDENRSTFYALSLIFTLLNS
jgi:hypothetical protein